MLAINCNNKEIINDHKAQYISVGCDLNLEFIPLGYFTTE